MGKAAAACAESGAERSGSITAGGRGGGHFVAAWRSWVLDLMVANGIPEPARADDSR